MLGVRVNGFLFTFVALPVDAEVLTAMKQGKTERDTIADIFSQNGEVQLDFRSIAGRNAIIEALDHIRAVISYNVRERSLSR